MLIVYWPITIKFRTCEQTSKPQTNYRCCLWFSYLAPYWLISRNTITFHKYFWCSRFCEFHSKREDSSLKIQTKPHPKNAKNPLPVKIHSSKTSLLKLSTIHKGQQEGEFNKTKTPNILSRKLKYPPCEGHGTKFKKT